ncbi:hypothetical protein C8J57DRAFT_1044747, partial [Mycena rebaudengoi]
RPVCGSCEVSGRNNECSWRDAVGRKPRTEAHFEALRKRADALQAYVYRLEAILAKCVCQDVFAPLQFRPEPGDHASPNDGGDSEADAASLDSDEDSITQELWIPTLSLKLSDTRGHGIAAPSPFTGSTTSRVVDTVEKPNASYVLQVDGVIDYDPDFDWSRHLPPEVNIKRKEHDKLLDLCFKFFSMSCLRIVPAPFLQDMYRALSSPPSQKPPETPHYSPMLHNALLSIAAVFSDDPRIRDSKFRHHFATAAKSCLEAECQKPKLSLVQACGFLAIFYGNEGDQILGNLYHGMGARIIQALGLGVDSRAKSRNFTNEELHSQNWAHWSIFSRELWWALWFGRDSGPSLVRRPVSVPFIDAEYDQLPWYHAPAKIPPQPNFLTLVFSLSTSLYLISYKIVGVVCVCLFWIAFFLLKPQVHSLELNNWKSQLPPELDITLYNRVNSTPQRLILHCMYWWSFILLHRPFFDPRARSIQSSDPKIDHVKLCKRAAENIMELLETWASLYTLRYTPTVLVQLIFSAGTVFLLLSLQATSSVRVAHGLLKTSLSQAELCIQCLSEMGRTWLVAARTGDALQSLLDDKLKPILARRFAHLKLLYPDTASASSADPQSEAPCTPSTDVHEGLSLAMSQPPQNPSTSLTAAETNYSAEWDTSRFTPVVDNREAGSYPAPFDQYIFAQSAEFPGFPSQAPMDGAGGEPGSDLDSVMSPFLLNFDSLTSGPSEQGGFGYRPS